MIENEKCRVPTTRSESDTQHKLSDAPWHTREYKNGKSVRPRALNINIEQSDASDVSGLALVAMLDIGSAETVTVNRPLKLLHST